MMKSNQPGGYQATIDKLLYQPAHFPEDKNNYPYTVAIILRTKDRPLCVPRAIMSIMNQTFKNWQLVIVNDGGNANALDIVLSPFKYQLGERLVVIHHATSLGMSRGLNVAIDASASNYIVVHDDDDTWHPDFLSQTVRFLKDPANSDCCGVATHAMRVIEEMTVSHIIEHERNDFNSKDNPFSRVSLYRLMMQNTFTTNSFLFKRSVINEIGYFNEDLPVLNDWDFNLRCALRYEIGMIPQHLAYYHHRITQQTGNYGNSIIATSNLCLQYETIIRNRWLRTLLNSESHAPLIGLCFAQGGQELASTYSPDKLDTLLRNQQITLNWFDKNMRLPLAQDIAGLQNHIGLIQKKLDLLLSAQIQDDANKSKCSA